MTRRLGRDPECFNVIRGGRHGALAVWKQGEVTVRTEFLESYVSRTVGREIRNPALLLVQIESPGRLAKWWKWIRGENTTGVTITPGTCSRVGPPPPLDVVPPSLRHRNQPSMRTICWALALVCLTGCERPSQPVSDLLPHVEPFGQLAGVRLGMNGHELIELRPSAQPKPYMGYTEQVGEFEVNYKVRGGERYEDQPVSKHRRVEAVRASRQFPSDSAGRSAYGKLVQVASRNLPVRPTCYSNPTSSVALWKMEDGDMTIAILDSMMSTAYRGTDTVPTQAVIPSRTFMEFARKSLYARLVEGDADPEVAKIAPPLRATPCPAVR